MNECILFKHYNHSHRDTPITKGISLWINTSITVVISIANKCSDICENISLMDVKVRIVTDHKT